MLHQVCKQEVLGGVGAQTGNLTEHNLIPPPTTTTTANLALLMIHTRKKGLLYSTKLINTPFLVDYFNNSSNHIFDLKVQNQLFPCECIMYF